ncbi:recombinase family protein [Chloroflexota bacterium]
MGEDVIDTSNSQGRFVLHIMAAVAELESAIIGDRVTAGMARAKAQGHRIGRKPLGIPVKNVCDALQSSRSISAAAREMKCSRGYIYKVLEKVGTTPEDVIKGRCQPPA